ncbi:cyclic di-GMP phosphodiesterase [Erwinia sp. JUb26]|uniref:cyclic di-GMP phosphodiesterase n=1 Tax=Erwinia sp. JUb26 TaxID=2485126 RepID=UPI000F4AABDE|nr:cyclic di-GMP phosphodiesterase [Erwinia sp. JUb26]ROR07769.1 EAL domain-containing protein (putative c-di-GMP-specific phosphodiesterase class I) [Erwinia sp. JUb26]
MPLPTNVTRRVPQPRRTVCLSAATGFIFFLLFITITLSIAWNRHSESHDRLAGYTQSYVINMFGELQQTLQPLQAAASIANCDQIRNDLIQRAAFAPNIRAILLVKNGVAFCSSATGPMSLAVKSISPLTDIARPLDIRLIPDTPMVPGKPAIAIWLSDANHPSYGVFVTLNVNLTPYLLLTSRHLEIAGMAIATKDNALTTWTDGVINLADLPKRPLRTITLSGYPLTLYFYGETLPARDVHVILLAGLLLSIIAAFACFLVLLLRQRQGKEIQQGMKRGEFHVEYQPVIEASSGRTYGLEALLRWTHPTEGRIPPDAFIGYAEGQNLIVPLTRHLFQLVARDAHQLCQTIPAGTRLGINISPLHLSYPTFRQDVLDWLEAMPQNHFEYIFEITERAMVDDRSADDIFHWIRQQNIKIAIDDFGTGHSALIYLEKFKFDYLKIDRGFVLSIGTETVNSPVLDAVLTLAQKLNLNTVAEGVETAEQALWLINGGISHLQGYLFSRPRTVPQLVDYFNDHPAPNDHLILAG